MLWSDSILKEISKEIDYIIPVPLHRFKLWQRKYNQAAILANEISKKIKVPALNLALEKIVYTPPQVSLTKIQRKQIVKNIYKTRKKYLPQINNKAILLIDDVYTTGSTINECAKLLKKSGSSKVFVVTISRTTIE